MTRLLGLGLFLETAPRMRACACDTAARPCVRFVLCRSAFLLVPPLPSADSAAACAALFAGFAGTISGSGALANAGGDTSPSRSSSATTSGLPDAAPGTAPGAVAEISRFPCRRRPYMPGSQTTRGGSGPRDDGSAPVAFCCHDGIGTPDCIAFAAPYLACTHPCQRFACGLTAAPA